MTRVLVIDDEPQILRALRINLRVRQYEVHTAATGSQALEIAGRHPPDLVILDLGLPDLDGVDVIHGLRGWSTAPIIVLSGRSDSNDKVEALDAGADDYVTKPFGMEELLARMRAASRRSGTTGELPSVRFGDLVIDLAAKRVTRQARGESRAAPAAVDGTGAGDGDGTGGGDGTGAGDGTGGGTGDGGEHIRLTPTEWHLLEVLLRHPGKLLSQQQLLTEVWGPGYVNATGNLRLYMTQLRRKLEPDPSRPRRLVTEPGMGYRYQPGPGDDEPSGPLPDGPARDCHAAGLRRPVSPGGQSRRVLPECGVVRRSAPAFRPVVKRRPRMVSVPRQVPPGGRERFREERKPVESAYDHPSRAAADGEAGSRRSAAG